MLRHRTELRVCEGTGTGTLTITNCKSWAAHRDGVASCLTGNSQSIAAPGVASMADFNAGAGQAPRGFVPRVPDPVPEKDSPPPMSDAGAYLDWKIKHNGGRLSVTASLGERNIQFAKEVKPILETTAEISGSIVGGYVYTTAEVISGEELATGRKLSTTERVVQGTLLVVPVVGGALAKFGGKVAGKIINAGLKRVRPFFRFGDDVARYTRVATKVGGQVAETGSDLGTVIRSGARVVDDAPRRGILDRIGEANLPYRTKATLGVKLSRFFATRTGYQQVIKHSKITKWLQKKWGWQSHHWAIARSHGRAGSEGLRRITEAEWNLIPMPAWWNRVIGNGGIGYNATRVLVGSSPVIAFGVGYKSGSFVIDVGWWLTGGESEE